MIILGVSPDSKRPVRSKVVPASGNGAPVEGGGENSKSAIEATAAENLSKLMEEKLQNSGNYTTIDSGLVTNYYCIFVQRRRHGKGQRY